MTKTRTQAAEPREIGFVGLGTMGGRIAGRLLAAGYEVYGTNRTRARAEALMERGLRWCETPRDVAAVADVIFSMVIDDNALRAVTSGPDGILAGLAERKIYVDMSTVSPETSRSLAEQVRLLGARMLDAPVSGGAPQAEEGSLTIMVGGDEQAFRLVEPLLLELARTVRHIGANGQALVLKLATNISLAVQILALSEGALIAERAGISRALALDVMTNSVIGSPALKARAPLLLEPGRPGWFDMRMMHKDLQLALDTARRLSVPAPSATATDEVLSTARELGYDHRDIAALIEVLERLSANPAGNGSRRQAATPR